MRVLAILFLSCIALNAQPVFSLNDKAYISKTSTLLRGLQGYWQLEESSGTRYDRSPNGNHLTANNSPTNTAGIVGYGMSCNYASKQCASIVDNDSLSIGSSSFSICCWVNLYTLSGNGNLYVASKSDASANGEFLLNYGVSNPAKFQFMIANATKFVQGPTGTSTNTWYFINCAFDSTAQTISIQVNNGTKFSTSVGTTVPGDSTNSFTIGSIAPSSANNYLNGIVDEFGMWKRVLTTNEVTKLYRSGLGVTYPRFSMRDNRADDFDFDTWEPLYDKPKPFPTLYAFVNRHEPEPLLTICE